MDSKQDYHEHMRAELRKSAFEIEKLQTKIDMAGVGADIVYYDQLETSRSKLQEARETLNALQQERSNEAWHSTRSELDRVWHELKHILYSSVSHFSG